ncbi:XRE family transcriptional regulator [Pseudoramibacter sp.]|jgi:transcriptional regulator with XRE-family HTH domain|uniref:XRE family transcriptional regulator n=1 Tax=Pseudoramibacter sp. TaxID=2034862 RepID=UPI0025DE6F6D|nr:XRE family transcriptional regulator [Pseudoramibacter sp.]MCH4071569.1 XRE family transcriptional regulator [Pseudoramibacter sp.]MCH4105337.1 XRE family transcriptional regulator [Pseudoramibacter sp.]
MSHIKNVKKTEELLDVLTRTDSPPKLRSYLDGLNPLPGGFAEYFNQLPKVQVLSKKDLIQKSGLDRTYAYHILNGTKQPSRDKIIALALAAGLDLTETQRALELTHEGILYAKNRRDAVLIYAVKNQLSVMEANDLLHHFGAAPLA